MLAKGSVVRIDGFAFTVTSIEEKGFKQPDGTVRWFPIARAHKVEELCPFTYHDFDASECVLAEPAHYGMLLDEQGFNMAQGGVSTKWLAERKAELLEKFADAKEPFYFLPGRHLGRPLAVARHKHRVAVYEAALEKGIAPADALEVSNAAVAGFDAKVAEAAQKLKDDQAKAAADKER